MAKQGKSSKIGTTKNKPSQVAYTQAMRWETNKRRRVERETKRKLLCGQIQATARAANRSEVPRKPVRDVSRRIRQLRRA